MKGIEGKGRGFRRREKMKDGFKEKRNKGMKKDLNYGYLKKRIVSMCHVGFAPCAL